MNKPIPTIKERSHKVVRIPGKRMTITRTQILDSQKETLSAAAAARWLGVSFNTYKKWAKYHDVFDQHLNQSGLGISKPQPFNPDAKKYKYFNPENNIPKFMGGVYWLGLKKKDSIEFKNKWGCNPIKVGKGKVIIKRVTEVLTRDYPARLPNSDMWNEWKEKATWIGHMNLWTTKEISKVERVFHHLLKEYKMCDAGNTREMFDVSWEKLFEVQEKIYDLRNMNLGKDEVL